LGKISQEKIAVEGKNALKLAAYDGKLVTENIALMSAEN